MSAVVEADARERLGGRYEIVALLGAGAMGRVYKAIDHELDEIVAVKVLGESLMRDATMLGRFRREVKLARRITHENVARVFDIGEHGPTRFLTMEFIEGESLGDIVVRQGALPIARAVAIARAMCAGLASAHAAGVVHRDLKPDNVLVSRRGRVVISDFGIARSAVIEGGAGHTLGHLVGTPAYMAPEQVEQSADVGPPADVFAFGATLYEMLTGSRPFEGSSPLVVAAARLTHDAPDPRAKRPSIPVALAELVGRCMARAIVDRPSCADVAAELAAIAAALPPDSVAIPASGSAGNRALSATAVTAPTAIAAAPAAAAPAPRSPAAHRTAVGGGKAPPPLAAPGAHDRALAMLPLRNTGAPEDAELAEGLAEEIIDHLSMVRGIRVRSAASTVTYKDRAFDARAVGAELGVDVVVSGSIQRSGDNFRLAVRIIGVADGFQIWAKRFDRPSSDILRVGEDVARAIAEALGAEGSRIEAQSIADSAAIDLYLRARAASRTIIGPLFEDKSISLYEQALTLAPGNPAILAGYATSLARRWNATGEGRDTAVEIAEQAIRAAPNLGEARLARANIALQDGDPVASILEAKRAVALAPGMPEANFLVGRLLVEAGHLIEGVRRLELVLELDPHMMPARMDLIRAYMLTGASAAEAEHLERLQAQDADAALLCRMRALLWRRDRGEALRLQPLYGRSEHPFFHGIIRLVLDGADALEEPAIVQQLARTSKGGPRHITFMAQLRTEVFACVGHHDDALDSIERATESGLFDLVWLDRCPCLEPLRDGPRFTRARSVVAARAQAILDAFVRS